MLRSSKHLHFTPFKKNEAVFWACADGDEITKTHAFQEIWFLINLCGLMDCVKSNEYNEYKTKQK